MKRYVLCFFFLIQTFRDLLHQFIHGEIFADTCHEEFITTVPGDNPVLRQGFPEYLCHHAQCPVSLRVTKIIVNRLHTIHICDHHGTLPALCLISLQGGISDALAPGPVIYTGQSIRHRQLRQFLCQFPNQHILAYLLHILIHMPCPDIKNEILQYLFIPVQYDIPHSLFIAVKRYHEI